MGKYDGAFYYNERYFALHDSLQKEVATSSLAISEAKLQYEVNRYNIIHPGFFINLTNKFSDITISEQRMTALTNLRFTIRQIASILCISVDSVHKSRQRLRQRFQVSPDIELGKLVSNL